MRIWFLPFTILLTFSLLPGVHPSIFPLECCVADDCNGGTAFFVTKREAVTVAHVAVDGALCRSIPAGLELKLISRDAFNDLALLRSLGTVSVIPLGVSKREPVPGDTITLRAFPGAEPDLLVISGTASGFHGYEMAVSLGLAYGFSGAPILNRQGEVVGVVHRFVDLPPNLHLGVAVRLRTLRLFLKENGALQ